ncbi:hypothetical protein BC941DRAFT_475958 [Chlamydoabsidia padenii]|nr:hypothetical protein BC941DRAFT_475958 [Chlamydoabsidia padenii]
MELEEYRRAVEQARVAGTESTTTTPLLLLLRQLGRNRWPNRKRIYLKNTSSTNKGNTSSSQTKTDSTPRANTSSQNKTNSTPESTKKLPVGITSLLAAYDDSDSD